MDASKKKKIFRHVGYGLLFVVLGACSYAASWLPYKHGLEWIPGWPEFLGTLLIWGIMIVFLAHELFKKLKKPLDEKFTKKKKALWASFYASFCVFYIGLSIYLGFINQWRVVDRYITSPNGKNKAVVMVRKEKHDRGVEYIYPVHARLFYKNDNNIYLLPQHMDITYTWLDDNTLEITKARKDSGEVETECLRW